MIILSSIKKLLGRAYSLVTMPWHGVRYGKGCVLSFCDGHSITGWGNFLQFGDGSQLNNCQFIIKGGRNRIIVGSRCNMTGVSFWISGNNNEILIGDDTTVGRGTQFAALEGTKISVGSDCMFSHDIKVRTSDSHSIVDLEGKRINQAKDVTIGKHCWIGMQALIMKGSSLADNTVLAARSTLNKPLEEANCVVGGAPARIIKTGTNWDRKKL